MGPLHNALQSWKGPESVLNAVREAGYGAHLVYRNCIMEFCGSKYISGDMDVYWRELARENVSSGGSWADLGKNRGVSGYYRSPYLDELKLTARNCPSRYPIPPSVHPCMFSFISEMKYEDRSLYPKIREKVEAKKADECIAHDISGARWDGYFRGLQILLDEVAELKGFEIIGSRRDRGGVPSILYGLKKPTGLVFYFKADLGGYEPISVKLPLEFSIGYDKVADGDFFVSDFRYIIPGFEQYAYYTTPESAVLGIHALVSAFDALTRSF